MSSDEPEGASWVQPDQPSHPLPAASLGWTQPPGSGGWTPPPPPPYGWGPPGQPQAPKPGIVPLRPLGVGEILDGAFTTIRRYPRATIGLSAAVCFVVQLIHFVTAYLLLNGARTTSSFTNDNTFGGDTVSNENAHVAGRAAALAGVDIVTGLVAACLLSGLIAAVIGQAALGRPMTAAEAWAAARHAFWRIVGVTLLAAVLYLAVLLVFIPAILVAVAGSAVGALILFLIAGLAAIVLVPYLWVAFSFAPTVVVLERQRVWASLRRSRALVHPSWWRIFGIELLGGLLGGFASAIITVPFALLSGISFTPGASTHYTFTSLLISSIGGFIATTLVRPFNASVITLLYLDRRMRGEGLDLTLAQAASAAPR